MKYGEYYQKAAGAADYLRERIRETPEVMVVLGSGWGSMIADVADEVFIPYADVPGMMPSTAPGHEGVFLFGRYAGKSVAVMCGRLHAYEGYSQKDITLPVRLMALLGAKTVLLTNAAGAVNASFSAGDIMLITDHISLTGLSPLTGANEDAFGPRFPDMTHAYEPKLLDAAREAARAAKLTLREGVYAQMPGPCYETPAEIRMLRTLGADAVGMSTVPEVIAARHSGMRVAGVSLMTNMAAGVLDQPLSHQEVLATAEASKPNCEALLRELIARA